MLLHCHSQILSHGVIIKCPLDAHFKTSVELVGHLFHLLWGSRYIWTQCGSILTLFYLLIDLHKNSYHILYYYDGAIISRWPKTTMTWSANCPHWYFNLFLNVGKNHEGQYSWPLNLSKKKVHETIFLWIWASWSQIAHVLWESPLMMSLWHALGIRDSLFTLNAFFWCDSICPLPVKGGPINDTNLHTRLQVVVQNNQKPIFIIHNV